VTSFLAKAKRLFEKSRPERKTLWGKMRHTAVVREKEDLSK
jgi:hypothetical protein